jgi:DNA modification methylase
MQETLLKSSIPVFCANHKLVSIEEVIPNPRNPNSHPDEQIALLAKIIKGNGWRSPIVVSKRSGFIVKGHGRLLAAKLLRCEVVPVDYQEYENEALEFADMIADNRIAELAEMEGPELKDLLLELDTGAFDMDLTGFEEAELERLMTQFNPEEMKDADAQMDRAAELCSTWNVKLGQVWLLGDHRLMCGDSTLKAQVERLLGQDKPNLMVTDPPYGVEYDANWRNEAAAEGLIGQKNSTRAIGKVENDDKADWTEAWKLFDGNVAYVWHAGKRAGEVQVSLESVGLNIRSQIIWAKNNFAISRGDYHWKHEPCWYAIRKGQNASWIGDRSQTTTWDIDKPMKSETGHSTQKPVECMLFAIRNHESEFVYEPFSGSGTTIIACENLKRKCRAIEISPAYVAVAIQRWVDVTGKEPKLLNE